jgi:thiamine pyrophosphate-dependent acetolactate synthase large subunit-like protein
LGKITKEQHAAMWDVWQTSLHNPDFSAYAQLCGAYGERVTANEDVDGALARAFAHDGVALIEVMTDAELV